MKKTKALSLIEVIVGMSIFTVVGLAVLGAIQQSAREIRTTSDHTIAMLLTQKVVDELLQDNLDSPFFADELAMITSRSGPLRDLYPFFHVIEDSAAPYGRLDSTSDLGIDPGDPDLYRLYGKVELAIRQEELPLAGTSAARVQKIEVMLKWPGFDGKLRESKQELNLLMPPANRPASISEMSIDDLDGMIRTAFYPGASGSLDSLASANGSDLDTVRRIGRVVVLMREANRILREPEPTTADPSDPSIQWIEKAKHEERKAFLMFQAVLAIQGPAASLVAESFGPGSINIPSPVISESYVAAQLRSAKQYMAAIDRSLALSVSHYVQAWTELQNRGIRAYRRLAIEKKVLDISFLRAFFSETPDLTFAHAWLDMMEEQYRSRSWILENYVARKKGHSGTASQLATSYQSMATTVGQARTAEEAITNLEQAVQPGWGFGSGGGSSGSSGSGGWSGGGTTGTGGQGGTSGSTGSPGGGSSRSSSSSSSSSTP